MTTPCASAKSADEQVAPYIFFRKEGWYPIEIPPSQLLANIELNPGTLKVEDINGNIVWQPQ